MCLPRCGRYFQISIQSNLHCYRVCCMSTHTVIDSLSQDMPRMPRMGPQIHEACMLILHCRLQFRPYHKSWIPKPDSAPVSSFIAHVRVQSCEEVWSQAQVQPKYTSDLKGRFTQTGMVQTHGLIDKSTHHQHLLTPSDADTNDCKHTNSGEVCDIC